MRRNQLFRALIIASLLLLPSLAKAQIVSGPGAPGGYYRDISFSWNGTNLIPNAGAQLTVCASTATAAPCSPAITIYSNAALTVTESNPITTGSDGSWSLYLPPGQYSYTVTGTGLNPQGPFIFNVPLTTLASLSLGNSLSQAYYSSWGPVTPKSFSLQGGGSSFLLNQPDFYLSRLDNTVGSGTSAPAGCTPQIIFSPCDEPVNRIDFSNRQTTGVIPNMLGLAIVGNGFASNTPTTGFVGNFQVGLATAMFDANQPNVVSMRGHNIFLGILGLPAQLAGGGQTRAVFGSEIDIQNSSGQDAVFNTSVGNYTGGVSIVSAGQSNTLGFAVSGNGSIAGKGIFTGFYGTDLVNCGMCLYHFPGGGGVSPPSAIHISTAGANGLVVGSGTITEAHNPDAALSNPTNGIVLDAQGTQGISETQDSNTLLFNAKTASSSATTWKIKESGSDNALRINGPLGSCVSAPFFSLGDPAADRFYFNCGSNLTGNKLTATQFQWCSVAVAGDLCIGSRGNQASSIVFYTSPDAGTTGLVQRMQINAAGNINLAGNLAQVAGINTIQQGVPLLVAEINLTAQTANIAATTLYAVPASGAGLYRFSCYIVETTTGTGSVTPSCNANWTDADSAAAEGPFIYCATNNANTVGAACVNNSVAYQPPYFNAKASTNIQYSTASGVYAGMQYAIHVRLEFLGP